MVNKQRGFTLVEIAIVLVIIGLLLGGILKGQELITAARVRNLASQAAGVQTAYYGFVDRYRAVPGDMQGTQACTAISNTVCGVGGNGNGTIASSTSTTDPTPWTEASAAWAHMAAAGFLQGNYAGTATADGTTGGAYRDLTILQAPINTFNGFLLLATTSEYSPAGLAPRLHLITGREVPVNVMREMDVKMDDSLPNTGILRSAPQTATAAFPGFVGSSDPTTRCVSTATPPAWNITGASADCNGYFLY
ncbi:MAG: prepilin-type N-terminal cleavage/methylation domain-containing protein [Gammaproteobacteria bacterium]